MDVFFSFYSILKNICEFHIYIFSYLNLIVKVIKSKNVKALYCEMVSRPKYKSEKTQLRFSINSMY